MVANPIFFIFGAFFSSVVCGSGCAPGREWCRIAKLAIRLIE
jgi:hypothetical protein